MTNPTRPDGLADPGHGSGVTSPTSASNQTTMAGAEGQWLPSRIYLHNSQVQPGPAPMVAFPLPEKDSHAGEPPKARKLPSRPALIAALCAIPLVLTAAFYVGATSLGWFGDNENDDTTAGQAVVADHPEQTPNASLPLADGGNVTVPEEEAQPVSMSVEFDGQEIDVSTLPEPEHRPLGEIGLTGFMFDALNDRQQQLYADMLFQMQSRRRMFRVSYEIDYSANESWEAIYRTLNAIMAEHPELFWVDTAGERYPYVDQVGPNEFFVGMFWNASEDEIDGLQARIDGATAAYLSQVSGAMTDYDKVLVTYDYVMGICDYDHADREAPRNQSIRSVLLDGKSVCSGYARTMSYLLGKVGIPCWYVDVDCEPTENDIADGVVLTERGKVAHACNIVSIEETWHYLDVTFGDALSSHYYMTMTSVDLDTIGHSISIPDVFPVCKDTRWDYYRVTGWFLSSSTPESLQEAISEAAARGWHEVPMKCNSQTTYEGCLAQLGDYGWLTQTISQATGTDAGGIEPMLSVDDTCRTITISW